MMVFSKEAIVGEIGLYLAVSVVTISALSPSFLALSLHSGIRRLIQSAQNGILFVRHVGGSFQAFEQG